MAINIIKYCSMDWSSGMEMYRGKGKAYIILMQVDFMSHWCDVTLGPGVCVWVLMDPCAWWSETLQTDALSLMLMSSQWACDDDAGNVCRSEVLDLLPLVREKGKQSVT